MFDIKLYNFNKKINSFDHPTAAGQTFDCVMLDDSSIINPVVTIQVQGVGLLADWNYAYIPIFKRYYFVTDTVWTDGIWTIYLKVDVLATYRAPILQSSQYVVRSTSSFNADIIDTAYMTVPIGNLDNIAVKYYEGYAGSEGAVRYVDIVNGEPNWNNIYVADPYFKTDITHGFFVLGIIGNNATGVTYFAFTYSSFKQFISKVTVLVPSNMSSVDTGIANAIYDPLQYIVSCKWMPHVGYLTNDLRTLSIKLGADTITLTGTNYAYYLPADSRYSASITIPKHPQSTENGRKYLNMPPFTEYNLFFEPFGNIPLDATKIYNNTTLYFTWDVDYRSGIAHLKISDTIYGAHIPERRDATMYDQIINYGVDIPVSGLVYDWKAGLALSAGQWMKENLFTKTTNSVMPSSGKAAGSGNKPSISSRESMPVTASGTSLNASDLLDRAMDFIGGALGQVKTVGSTGSFLPFTLGVPYIYAYFYGQSQRDIDRFGAPLYRVEQLSALTGFILCKNASIPSSKFDDSNLNPTAPEYDAIIDWLNSGVYNGGS